MTIETVITAIQAKNQTILTAYGAGTAPAPTAYPLTLDPASMPYAIAWPGAAEWNFRENGLARHPREIVISVYLEQVLSGTGPAAMFSRAAGLLQAFMESYCAPGATNLGGELATSMEMSDTGIDRGREAFLIWEAGGPRYHGFEITLRAMMKGVGL